MGFCQDLRQDLDKITYFGMLSKYAKKNPIGSGPNGRLPTPEQRLVLQTRLSEELHLAELEKSEAEKESAKEIPPRHDTERVVTSPKVSVLRKNDDDNAVFFKGGKGVHTAHPDLSTLPTRHTTRAAKAMWAKHVDTIAAQEKRAAQKSVKPHPKGSPAVAEHTRKTRSSKLTQ